MDRGIYRQSCNSRYSLQIINLPVLSPGYYYSPNTSTTKLTPKLSTVHSTTLVLSTGLTLALAPTGAFAWAKAANGVWVANNKVYP